MMNTIALILVLAAAAPAKTGTTPTSAPKAAAPKSVTKVDPTKTEGAKTEAATNGAAPKKSDEDEKDMTMRGGQEGTVFKSLTVEGEDKIRLEFERPTLNVELDPAAAPGLDWGSAKDVLDRTRPDFAEPLNATSAFEPAAGVGHPWLNRFSTGAVAKFRPDVDGVESWKLAIVDAHGEAVANFGGKGAPPKEIIWNGLNQDGKPVTPGLTYSSVFEAHDKAGNKRNFVGQGFKVSAYRLESKDGMTLVLSAKELPAVSVGRSTASAAPPILIEAASWLNQSPPTSRIRVAVSATSRDLSQALADQVAAWMIPYLLGDPARVQVEASIAADAPEGGTITLATPR